MTPASTTEDPLGPVDILVIGFPDGLPHASGFDKLAGLVDAGTIRILDLEFVRRDENGAQIVEAAELPPVDGFDPGFWTGASSHLLDADDLDRLAADLELGELAVVLLIEEQWILGLIDSGARLVADGGVSHQDLIAALDAAEQS